MEMLGRRGDDDNVGLRADLFLSVTHVEECFGRLVRILESGRDGHEHGGTLAKALCVVLMVFGYLNDFNAGAMQFGPNWYLDAYFSLLIPLLYHYRHTYRSRRLVREAPVLHDIEWHHRCSLIWIPRYPRLAHPASSKIPY